MILYSGTTCPFSHRCRFLLYEKGMDFEVRDVDVNNIPADILTMNPYGEVPVLVEREFFLYEANIICEYLDERFPHPQLMPAEPVLRVCSCLILNVSFSHTSEHLNLVKLTRALKRSREPIFVIN